MPLFSKKHRPSGLARELDQPVKRGDLQDMQPDMGFDDFYNEPKPRMTPPPRQPVFPVAEQPIIQPSLAPRSFTDNTYEIILSKIDVIDAKLDGLLRRIDMLERLVQSLQQPPASQQDNTRFQRRMW
ncbi:MAG: hypothetical protein AABX72_02715 [Nanoarchaeota archaeon]